MFLRKLRVLFLGRIREFGDLLEGGEVIVIVEKESEGLIICFVNIFYVV